jgi:hypothetical protein
MTVQPRSDKAQAPNFPIPAGAVADRDWPSLTDDNVPVRSLVWSSHDTNRVGISVGAIQFGDDGRIEEVGITLFGNGKGESAIGPLTLADAEELLAALNGAANALEAIR